MKSLSDRMLFSKVSYQVLANEKIDVCSYTSYWFQILEGLLANSVAHGFVDKKGHIDITVEQNDTKVTIVFCDDGCGISEDKIKNVFEPFYTSKRNQGHIGLGLHIIYNIITQSLKGTMHYQTSEKGACFIIVLPRALPMETALADKLFND